MNTWNQEEQALWQRIQQHPLTQAERPIDLMRRAEREYGWKPTFARLAIEEYRRFCFLCARFAGQCSPSPVVDAVWHLHLIDTKDYWQRFCPDVLRFELHHAPSNGSLEHRAALAAQYAQTQARYGEYFGPPARAIWPPGCGPAHRLQVQPGTWLQRISLALFALGASSSAWSSALNPLDWTGPKFLSLLLLLFPLVAWLSYCMRASARRLDQGATKRQLRPLELGLIAGGHERAIDVLISELLAGDYLRPNPAHPGLLQVARSKPGAELSAEAVQLLGYIPNDSTPSCLRMAMMPRLRQIEATLQRERLLLAPEQSANVAYRGMWPFFAWQALLLSKLVIGLMRDRPVGFLVFLAVIVGVIMLVLWRNRPYSSSAGVSHVKVLAIKFRTLPSSRSDWPQAVAVLGIAALSSSVFANYASARTPPSSGDSGSSGSDSGSGDSGGGSGCGDCGGGD